MKAEEPPDLGDDGERWPSGSTERTRVETQRNCYILFIMSVKMMTNLDMEN